MLRGPLIGTVTNTAQRNVIGTHAGSYSVYRAVAVAAGALDPLRKPDLTNTSPTHVIGPFPSWFDPTKIVSLDPFGALVSEVFKPYFEQGYDIRPTMAVTRAHIQLPELEEAIAAGTAQGRWPRAQAGRFGGGREGCARTCLVFAGRGCALRLRRGRSASNPVRAHRRHVSRAGHALGLGSVHAADRRRHRVHVRETCRAFPIRTSHSRCACTTNATARTCSAPTSAPAGRT